MRPPVLPLVLLGVLVAPGPAAAVPDPLLAAQAFDGLGSLGAKVERALGQAVLTLGLMVIQFHEGAEHVLRFFPREPDHSPPA
jgi:hypothetical protein